MDISAATVGGATTLNAPAPVKQTIGAPPVKASGVVTNEHSVKPVIAAEVTPGEPSKEKAAEAILEAATGKESTPEAEPVEVKPEVEDKDHERYAQLLKLEKRVQAEKTQAKEEIAKEKLAFEDVKKAHEVEIKAAADIQKEVGALRGNAGGVIDFIEKHLGLSITDLADFYIKGSSPEYQLKKLEEKLAREKEEEKANSEKVANENLTKQQQANVTNYKNQITEHFNSNIEAYELTLDELGDSACDEAYKLIELHWAKTQESGKPELLTPEQAAIKLEDFFQAKELRKLKLKKLSKYVRPDEATTTDKKETVKSEVATDTNKTAIVPRDSKQPLFSGVQKKTLNNINTAQLPSPINKAKSNQDRYSRAAAAMMKK